MTSSGTARSLRSTEANVGQLALDWFADLDTARGQEATPIVIDGTIYVSTAWSMVKAYDGRTGRLLWSFDPHVPRERLVRACCDAVNRGVAAWNDSLFVGTLDGRLIALDRHTGRQLWSTLTVDQAQPYTITGAPRVIDGRVIIGNGGAEYGVRGYVTAYDAADGHQLWRFYTVPGNPAAGFEGDYLRRAADTWHGQWWRLGGGGTVWDSIAYDPELDLLYIGVGNGSPWNQLYRSEGQGDNLYLSSIVAIRPETGQYVWHFQETPGESWDYTATQHIILADLIIDGHPRKVLMQAPKNGFFYVIDRTNGQLISARNYVQVNWATGIDMRTGRPIENPEARYYRTGRPFIGIPGAAGGHDWQPMSFDPQTGLVYIPAQDAGFPYLSQPNWRPAAQGFNNGLDMATVAMPAITAARNAARAGTRGQLIAWDPIHQREVWRHQYQGPWNGGVLSTAGGLVFQGSAAGNFAAFDAATGRQLWTFPAQTGIVAAPITYTIGGQQYVAVLAGLGRGLGDRPGRALRRVRAGAQRLAAARLPHRRQRPPAARPALHHPAARSARGPRAAARRDRGCRALRPLLRRLPRRRGGRRRARPRPALQRRARKSRHLAPGRDRRRAQGERHGILVKRDEPRPGRHHPPLRHPPRQRGQGPGEPGRDALISSLSPAGRGLG